MMHKRIVPIFLAGGSGTRLWPLSRQNYPKQFLKLIGKHSLFQEALLRVKQISGVKESIIVTNESHYFICCDQIKEAEVKNTKYILEPCSRNTAPAIAIAAKEIVEHMDGDTLMLVLPADHLIGNTKAFATIMESAAETAEKGHFVTFGIMPTSPQTGYGYIQSGKQLDSLSFEVKQFVEKPNKKTAETFLAEKNYFWNSGMFFFQAKGYLEELKKTAPFIYETCMEAYLSSDMNIDYLRVNKEHFEKCPSDSIDYAVMEKTHRAVIIPLQLPWNDLGCWASVADVGEADHKNNVIRGNVIMKDCEGCLLSSESEPLVATIGIKDQIVVSTSDAVLVADKAYAQEVKGIVNSLKNTHHILTTHHKQVHCLWGYYEKLVDNSDFQIKHLVINSGKTLLLESSLFLTVIRGEGEIIADDKTLIIKKNMSYHIRKKSQIKGCGKEGIHILEIKLFSKKAKSHNTTEVLDTVS